MALSVVPSATEQSVALFIASAFSRMLRANPNAAILGTKSKRTYEGGLGQRDDVLVHKRDGPMADLVANCPRCGSRHITFDVTATKIYRVEYGWQNWYEAFGICRNCGRTTIFVLSERVNTDYQYVHKVGLLKVDGSLNNYVDIKGHISLKDSASIPPPEFLPRNIEAVFEEGATCLAVGCYNAAGTMFRLCVDLATQAMLPGEDAPGLNAKTRRDLGLRLPWLFEAGRLHDSLKELSSCIKEDGNDGAHGGNLTEDDASDLLDFTSVLLERIYTEPERLRLAKERRDARRAKPA